MSSIEAFFAYARERHNIYLRRKYREQFTPGVSQVIDELMGNSLPGPWTTDPILQQYRFTNVFRELDRTTVWYRENVREKVSPEDILLATVVFRWFNRIATGEAVFTQTNLLEGGGTAFDVMLSILGGNGEASPITAPLRQAIVEMLGDPSGKHEAWVTGAYIIKTPDGYNKLDGVLKCIEWFMEGVHDFRTPQGDTVRAGYKQMSEWLVNEEEPASLESVWLWLKQFPFLGDFMTYEIVTDLRWSIMKNAPDIMTWANPGPGATRGLGRIHYNDKDKWNQHRDKELLVTMMQNLLRYSRDPYYWPQQTDGGTHWAYPGVVEFPRSDLNNWPAWEMRDVEHTLCEFDKYERVRTGEGRPRGRFA